MPKQKLYRNGNSVAVTIPKEILRDLNLNENSEVMVLEDVDSGTIMIKADHPSPKPNSSLTPEFKKWLEDFNKRYGPTLRELAKK